MVQVNELVFLAHALLHLLYAYAIILAIEHKYGIRKEFWSRYTDKGNECEDESDAITNQIVRLIYYLKQLPVDLLSIDKIEADDVIGYI